MDKIILSFEELFTKYKNILSLKELVDFSKQLADAGYNLAIGKDKDIVNPISKPGVGLFDSIRRMGNGNKEIELTPGQEYMYRWKEPWKF
ncbi:MAG: hypothetical protein PHH82_03660 [Candidatus ainarchaeum sp.]|nr:hypothetical protein [Candidatus ainarchaeum sp.]